MQRSRVASPPSVDGTGLLVRQKGGGRISEIQAQGGFEDGLVAFDGEQAESVLGMDHLHKVGMGMQRIGGIHARSVWQTRQDFFGNGNLVGFRDFHVPAARFPGSHEYKREAQCGAGRWTVPAPLTALPSRATASSSRRGRLLNTQAASTTSIACASKRGRR